MSSIYGMVSKTESSPDAAHLAAMRAVLPQSPISAPDSECHEERISLGIHHARRPLLTNESHTITLACVGAIPNYRDLREDLLGLGHIFTTPHDAETLVHLYEEQGPNLLSLVKGPFSFALWDAPAQRLMLACDPTGQKPLYLYEDDENLIFASTIPALLAHPSVPRQSALTDTNLLAIALHTGQMPESMTAFQHIRVLGAGQMLIWDTRDSTTTRYWHMPPFAPAEPEATIVDHEDRLRERLAESVRLHLTHDESVGVLLSGGISSGLVAAMMQQQNRVLRTFTIRFQAKDTPEIARAAEIAKHLQAKHTVLTIKPPDLKTLLTRLVWHTAQPLLSPHDVLMGLLSKAVQGHIQVALTGTGGVPLLGNPMQELKQRPRLRRMWQAASTFLQRTRAARQREEARAADSLALFLPAEINALIGMYPDIESRSNHTEAVIAAHLTQHLAPGTHISAASGVDAQVPFADALMIEAAALVPFNLKQRPGQPLYVLSESARGLLPSAFLKTPVPQEHMPLDVWMRDQQAFIRDMLLGEKTQTRNRNFVNNQTVHTLIETHMTQKHDTSVLLLALLSLEIWHRLFIDTPALTPPA